VVFYEGAKEILDAPDRYLLASAGQPDRFYFGFCRSAVCIYAFLNSAISDYQFVYQT
jgi:hypothetical protein